MGLLSSLLGNSRRRGYGGFGSRRGSSFGSYGRGRSSGNFLSSNLGRLALGGLAAYGARQYMNARRQQQPPTAGPSGY